MIEHFAATDGEPVPATTETNSTPSTLAAPLKNSPSTHFLKLPTGLTLGKDGSVKRKRGRPRKNTRTEIAPNKYYNLKFKGGRKYKLTFTSFSDAECFLEVDLTVVSLRKLMAAVSMEVSRMHRPNAVKHFSMTLKVYPEAQNMHTETVSVLEVDTVLEGTEAPIMQHGALDEGLTL
jgi:hypothetical protein